MSPDGYDPMETPRCWEAEHDDWRPEDTATPDTPEDEPSGTRGGDLVPRAKSPRGTAT
jgi:hypothetical protein